MIITIHQPNFFPYYPFFQKMEEADIFVILTYCQFEKNNFQNRYNKDSKWYVMCVNKGLDPIYTKTYLNPEKVCFKKPSFLDHRKSKKCTFVIFPKYNIVCL